MKKIVVAAVVFSMWLGAVRVASAQPVLERLEKAIRRQVDRGAKAAGPADRPAVERPAGAPAGKPDFQPGYLGLVADDKKDRGRGLRVLDVRPDGPAEKAGIRKHDLITALAGVQVRQMAEMADILELFPAGDTLTVDILRAGKPQKVKVTLGRRGPRTWRSAALAEAVPAPPAETPPGGERLPAAGRADRPSDAAARIEQLQRRVAELERRVAELQRALAEALEKK